MDKRLEEAVAQVKALPRDRQREAAEILFEFLDRQNSELHLTPEQIAEIERAISGDEPHATDEDHSGFAHLAK
jgi:hypothetical protein